MNGPLGQIPSDANRPWLHNPRDSTSLRPRVHRSLAEGSDAYVPAKEVTKYYNVSAASLRRFAKQSKIRTRHIGEKGHRLYHTGDLQRAFPVDEPGDGQTNQAQHRRKIAYARVSSETQRPDLERQVAELRRLCPYHEIVSEVASGLNWKRRGLLSVLGACFDGVVEEVAVLHHDRLARFAVELLEHIFARHDTRLVVVGQGDASAEEAIDAADPSQELADDLIAVTTFFVARQNGLRSAAHRRARRPWRKEQKAKFKSIEKKRRMGEAAKAKANAKREASVGTKRKQAASADATIAMPTEDRDPIECKTRKVRIFPTTEQKDILKRWIGTVRWTYNRCNAAIRDGECKATLGELREKFVNREAFAKRSKTKNGVVSYLLWVLDTPYDIRDQAVAEVVQAHTNAKKKHGIDNFEVKFRSIKLLQQESLTIRSRNWNRDEGEYARIFRNDRLRASEPLPFEMPHDFKVIRTRLGIYYLSIPVDLEVRSENQAPFPKWVGGEGGEVIAIDPGVRTPFCCFDPQGYVYEIGGGDFARIRRLCKHLDDLQSRWSQPDVRKKRRYRMKRAGARMRRRIRNLVDELHRKTAAWLCESYRVILYPHYETSNMVSKKAKRISQQLSSKTARAMLTWAHFRFKQHLLHKIREYPWCRVVLVNEAFTSKTCTECGHVKTAKFRRHDTFECDACPYVTNRDWNGARGIWLRFLTEWAGDPFVPTRDLEDEED